MAKHKKASGGEADFGKPREDWKEEEKSKPKDYTADDPSPAKEAEEKKKGGAAKAAGGAAAAKAGGGRAKRRHGGKANMHISKHHEAGEHMKHAKHLGKVHGEQKFHAGKAGRSTGGRTGKASGGSNFAPLSSAHGGSPPRDHKVEEID